MLLHGGSLAQELQACRDESLGAGCGKLGTRRGAPFLPHQCSTKRGEPPGRPASSGTGAAWLRCCSASSSPWQAEESEEGGCERGGCRHILF